MCWVEPLSSDWVLGLEGVWQRSNAAVAKAVLERIQAMGWPVDGGSIRAGLASTHWPGRLQRMAWQQHTVLLDGAHNPPAAEALRQERSHWPYAAEGLTWILAIQAHKQAPAMLQTLLEPQDQAWIVPVPGHHSWTRAMLLNENLAWAQQLFELPAKAADDDAGLPVIRVLEQLERQGWPAATPVIAGSLYLLGDLLASGCLQPSS